MPRLPLAKHPPTGVDPLECNAVMPSSSPLAHGRDQGPPTSRAILGPLGERRTCIGQRDQLGAKSEPSKGR